MIAAWRRDLGEAKLPVYVGLINPVSNHHNYVAEVQQEICKLVDTDTNIFVVSAEGLSKLKDAIHHDTKAPIAIGERFADAVLGSNSTDCGASLGE